VKEYYDRALTQDALEIDADREHIENEITMRISLESLDEENIRK